MVTIDGGGVAAVGALVVLGADMDRVSCPGGPSFGGGGVMGSVFVARAPRNPVMEPDDGDLLLLAVPGGDND